jgi:hypothetical protein
MKKLLFVLAALALSSVPWPTLAVVPRRASAHVQTKQNNATGAGSTVAAVFDSSVTAGNFLVCGAFASGAFSSIASNQSDTFVQVSDDASNPYMRTWTAKSAVGGSTTVTLTMSGSFVDRMLSCHEYSGLDNTSDYDQASITSGFSTTCSSGNTAALTQADNMVVGFCGEAGTAAITKGATYTDRGSTATAARTLQAADKTVSSTSAVSYTATWTGATTWRAAVMALKDGSAGVTFPAAIINAPVRGGGRR